MEQENAYLEYKEDENKSYLKTVSAFANYHDGIILFGVDDNLLIKGINDVKKFCENIENQINDSIKPKPNYTLTKNLNNTISLMVYKGENIPYLYHGKAYKRNNTSTIEVDDYELRRLILEGMNKDFENIPCKEQNLSFSVLANILKERLNINTFNTDIMKTLNLYSDKEGYNVAAGLLADVNEFYGIDLAVFGNSEDVIKERINFSGKSLISQYFETIKVFERIYCYEIIQGSLREKKQIISLEAFRESLANSIIHRTWDVRVNTKISMYPDRVVVSSPGGLPSAISKEQYLNGDFSHLRNPILANVFHRIGIVEVFATGIKRINREYLNSVAKPVFRISDNSIVITLPKLSVDVQLTENELKLKELMTIDRSYTRDDLESVTGFNKATLLRLLNNLILKNTIIKKGKASKTIYVRIK